MICYCPNCQAEVSCTAADRALVCEQCQQSFAVAVPTLSPQESARLHRASGGWMRSLLTLAAILLAVWVASLIVVPRWDRSEPHSRIDNAWANKSAVSDYLMATLEHPDFQEHTWHVGGMDRWEYASLKPSGSIMTNPAAEVRMGDPYVVIRLTFGARNKSNFGYEQRSMTFLVNNRTNKVFAAGDQPPAELIDTLLKGDSAEVPPVADSR